MNKQTTELGVQLDNAFQIFNKLSEEWVSEQDMCLEKFNEKEQLAKSLESLLTALDEFVSTADESYKQSLTTRAKIIDAVIVNAAEGEL